jgi:hypothetical protein
MLLGNFQVKKVDIGSFQSGDQFFCENRFGEAWLITVDNLRYNGFDQSCSVNTTAVKLTDGEKYEVGFTLKKFVETIVGSWRVQK